MGNLPCKATSKKPSSSGFLFEKSIENLEYNPKNEENKCSNDQIQRKHQVFLMKSNEIQETSNFMKNYIIFKQNLEINSNITAPNIVISHETFSKTPQKNPENSEKPMNSPIKSFKDLFNNDDSLYIPALKPSSHLESLQKSHKETKNSTPNFFRNSMEINELLPYLPKQPSFISILSEEIPRKLTIKQIKLESLEISEENQLEEDKTFKEFSIEAEKSSSESSEPQQIHINLLDLLQNELKTRRNSLSMKGTPIKTPQNQEKLIKNDSQSSFRTLKKTDFLSPLKQNQNATKETLYLSKKIT